MEVQELITPAVVSGIVTGILAPLLFYFLKRQDERKKRNFEVRYAEFKTYVGALEEIARSNRSDLKKMLAISFSEIEKCLTTDPDNMGPYILRAHKALDDYVDRARDSLSKSQTELRGLKLVCSDELLGLLNDFVQRQEELFNDSVAMIDRLKRGDFTNPEDLIPSDMKEKAGVNADLFDKILNQMRKELDIVGS